MSPRLKEEDCANSIIQKFEKSAQHFGYETKRLSEPPHHFFNSDRVHFKTNYGVQYFSGVLDSITF